MEEIHALYQKELKSIRNFVAIGSEEDEREVKKMNERAAGIGKRKFKVDADITKEEVEEEIPEESPMKKSGKKVKSIARKKRFKKQKSDADLEEEEKLKTFLTIVPVEDAPLNYDTLSKKFPIVDWKYCLLGKM